MKNLTKYTSYVIALLFSQSIFGFSNIEIGNCNATVFKAKNMSTKGKALALTAAHCLKNRTHMSKNFKNKDRYKEFYNSKMLAGAMIYKDHKSVGIGNYGTSILYASMENTDVAVVELSNSYEELSNLGITPLELAQTPAKVGDKLSFNSFYLQTDSLCEIEEITSIKEDIYTFNSAYKLKLTPKCSLIPGNSGTAGVIDGKIYQVAFTMNEKQPPRRGKSMKCKLNNPCETQETAKGQSYSVDVTFLNKCYNTKKKKFDFSASCIHKK